MKSLSKWFSGLAAIVLMAGTAAAADAITNGKVKAINAGGKEVVVADAAGKEFTFKLGDNVVINRGGKEGKNELNAGDAVNIFCDKGLDTLTARYVLVREGDAKTWELMQGTVKGYDADNKELTFADEHAKDWKFAVGDAKVRLSKEALKAEDIKVGDHALVIVDKNGDKTTLKSVMIERK